MEGMEGLLTSASNPDASIAPAKATEAELTAEKFIGGFKPADWVGTSLSVGKELQPGQFEGIRSAIQDYQNNLKSMTQDNAGEALGKKILSDYGSQFSRVFGNYTTDQALELFKNKPMQVIQGLVAGIPYSSPTMPMSIAQALKQYSYIIPGASVGKGGGLFRTIKIPKGITNRPTKYRAPNPVMILMQITNFIWHLLGLPGMAPYYVSQAAMAYYRSLIDYNPTKETMTKVDVANILAALENNHPAMMSLFYDSQIYSRAATIAKENAKTKLAGYRAAFKNQLNTINSFQKGQELFGQLIATSNSIKVTPIANPEMVKSNLLNSYGNPTKKPVKMPKGVGYYTVGSGDYIKGVKTAMGNAYTYTKGKWDGIEGNTIEEGDKTKIITAMTKENTAADVLESTKAEAEVEAAKKLLESEYTLVPKEEAKMNA